jgi:cell wall-associated NlpC family hydrolase
LVAIGKEAGLVDQTYDPGKYDVNAPFLKRGADDVYIQGTLQFCREISEAEVQPGDVVLYKVGRGFSHGAVVVDWPTHVIHATKLANGVIGSHGTDEGVLLRRERRYFSFWGK